jgi:hypothetical protein
LKREFPDYVFWEKRRLRKEEEKKRIEIRRVRIFIDSSFERNSLTSNSNFLSRASRARRLFGPGSNVCCVLRALCSRCGGSRDERARGSR